MPPILRTRIHIPSGRYTASSIRTIRASAQRAADQIADGAEGYLSGAIAAPVILRFVRDAHIDYLHVDCWWPDRLGGCDAQAEARVEEQLEHGIRMTSLE